MLLCSGIEVVHLLFLLYEEENETNSENPEEPCDRITHVLCTDTVCSLFPEWENRIAILGVELDTQHWVRVHSIAFGLCLSCPAHASVGRSFSCGGCSAQHRGWSPSAADFWDSTGMMVLPCLSSTELAALVSFPSSFPSLCMWWSRVKRKTVFPGQVINPFLSWPTEVLIYCHHIMCVSKTALPLVSMASLLAKVASDPREPLGRAVLGRGEQSPPLCLHSQHRLCRQSRKCGFEGFCLSVLFCCLFVFVFFSPQSFKWQNAF